MSEMIANMIQVMALLAIGRVLNTKSIINEETAAGIRKLIINLTLPAVLFLSFVNLELTSRYFLLFIIVFLMHSLFLGTALLLNKVKALHHPLVPFFCSGCAYGFIGIPFFLAVYGLEEMGQYAVLGVGHEFYLWMFLFPGLHMIYRQEKMSLAKSLNTLKSPVLMAIGAGILFNGLQLNSLLAPFTLYQGLFLSVEALASLTTPLILLMIGYGILLNTTYLKESLKLIALRLVIVFGLGYAVKALVINQLIAPNPVFNHAFFTFLVLPPPLVIPIFVNTLLSEEQGELASSAITLHTLISIGLYMIVVIFR